MTAEHTFDVADIEPLMVRLRQQCEGEHGPIIILAAIGLLAEVIINRSGNVSAAYRNVGRALDLINQQVDHAAKLNNIKLYEGHDHAPH
jgi:hypothetical protein